ncbi:hypothetical protein [Streptomyces sp. LN590]|uniref:hypothetical protein n=1 Tax=Streptomyces sp. LN590 TaxID=3112980 RepID=UPI00371EA8C8
MQQPVVQQRLHLRVQGDVAVGVHLADRDAEPVGGADLHDRVDSAIGLTDTDLAALDDWLQDISGAS